MSPSWPAAGPPTVVTTVSSTSIRLTSRSSSRGSLMAAILRAAPDRRGPVARRRDRSIRHPDGQLGAGGGLPGAPPRGAPAGGHDGGAPGGGGPGGGGGGGGRGGGGGGGGGPGGARGPPGGRDCACTMVRSTSSAPRAT